MSETNKNNNASDLTNLGAFWKKEKNGKSFLSGKVKIGGDDYTAFIFKNDKSKPNQPDYRLVIADLDESLKPDSGKKTEPTPSQSDGNQDDIPF